MESDLKNRFNEKRPFDVVRAEDFGEDLYEFYEPLEKLVRKVSGVDITGSRPVFLIGGRGTGKTMVLKFLSVGMQLKHFISQLGLNKPIESLTPEEMERFLKSRRFIGIYLRFKTTEYDSMKDDLKPFFKPYLSIKVAEQLFGFLGILKACHLLPNEKETKIIDFFVSQVKEPKLDAVSDIDGAIRAIKEKIIPMFEVIEAKYSYYSIEDIKKQYQIPVIIYNRIVFDFSDLVFSEIDCLRGKNLFVLLDELEYLTEYQARCIGEMIKNSDETAVIFKVGSRYMPSCLPVGQSSEVLQEPHDLRQINITDALNAAHSGRKSDYSSLIKSILNKRLKKSTFFKNRDVSDIEQLFPKVPLVEEARDLVRGRQKHWERFQENLKGSTSQKRIEQIVHCLIFPDNPIIEKLNMLLFYRGKKLEEIGKMLIEYCEGKNAKYATLYEKNALNLLFQLYNDYREDKKYAGIDIFIHVSSGIIRNAIELCNQALNTAYNYGYEDSQSNSIEVGYQDIGAKAHAKLQYDDILRIPGAHCKLRDGVLESPSNIGMEVQDFINQLGTIFRALHLDRCLVEPEQTHFETDYSALDNYCRDVIEAAMRYSYLQEKPPMGPKDIRDTRKKDLLLNRVFAPHFRISYRARGRTYILPSQIHAMICGDERQKKQIRTEIIVRNTRKRRARMRDADIQKTLLDLDR